MVCVIYDLYIYDVFFLSIPGGGVHLKDPSMHNQKRFRTRASVEWRERERGDC